MDRFCKTNANGSYDVLMKLIYSFGNSLKYFQELHISIYQKKTFHLLMLHLESLFSFNLFVLLCWTFEWMHLMAELCFTWLQKDITRMDHRNVLKLSDNLIEGKMRDQNHSVF